MFRKMLFYLCGWQHCLRGKETNNSTLIKTSLKLSNTKVSLKLDYNYIKSHRPFKSFKTLMEPVKFKRIKCKKLNYNESADISDYQDATKSSLSGTIVRFS